MTEGGQAWVTLATNDSYALGAVVLANSLKRVNTTGKLVVMVTPGISGPMRGVLDETFNEVVEVNVLDSEDTANLALLTRPELGITFTKLHCWRLTQYEKCVFLDSDTLVLQNCDELFNREEFSAAPDSGWPDCFNSGVYVFRPSLDTYAKLLQFAIDKGSFDGGDQGLLNLYFSDWSTADISKHLPFIYNMVASATYSYAPAYKVFGHNVKIAHFIGPVKPWVLFFDSSTGQVRPEPGQEHLLDLLQAWWDIFRAEVHPKLSPEMKGLAGAYAKMTFYGNKSWEQLQYEDSMRKSAWEQGNIDYLGRDSFDNIMARIQASMAEAAVVTQRQRAKSPSPAKQTTPKQRTPEKSPPPPASEPANPAPAAEAPKPEVAPTPAPEPVQQTPVPEPVQQAPAPAPVQQAPVPEPVQAAPAPEPVQAAPAPEPVQAALAPEPVQAAPTAAPEPVKEVKPVVPEPVKAPEQVQAAPAPVEAAKPVEKAAEPVPVPAPTSTPAAEVPMAPSATQVAASAPAPAAQPAPKAAPQKSAEELEDEKLAAERQVLEKKLGEQKISAEQKLQEEKSRAAAAAASAPAPKAAPAPAAPPAAAPAKGPQQAAPQPQAPPRGKPKDGDES